MPIIATSLLEYPDKHSVQMYAVVLVACPDVVFARKLARSLLRKRLIACANILPAIESMYWWKGRIESGCEMLLLLKTREKLFKRVEEEIRRHHPYEVPEIIMFQIKAGSGQYLEWINSETKR